MNDSNATSMGHVVAARRRIAKHLRPTPLVHAFNLSKRTGIDLYLKLESAHVTGAFKERGALNRLLRLRPEERERGVIAASAGNHAQALSLHASRLGIDATIVMPEHTPIVKVSRTQRYGAEVVLSGATFDDANALAIQRTEEHDLTYIPAFDDPDVIAGQGTCALEILDHDEDFDAVLVPVGGGGLIAGMATALKEGGARSEVIGVQTSAFPSMLRSLEAGRPTDVDAARTIADGIAVRCPGVHTFALAQRYVDRVVTAGEEDLARAILTLIEDERVIAEGAAAAPRRAPRRQPRRPPRQARLLRRERREHRYERHLGRDPAWPRALRSAGPARRRGPGPAWHPRTPDPRHRRRAGERAGDPPRPRLLRGLPRRDRHHPLA